MTDSILKQYALVVSGGKVNAKTCAKKIILVNLFIKFLKAKRRVIFRSPHTRLRQLAVFPSLIVRLSFAVSISEVRGKWGGFFFFRIDKFAN